MSIRIILLLSLFAIIKVSHAQEASLLPSDVNAGDASVTSIDGLCQLEAKGPVDARLIAGGQFIGIESSANTKNAAGDEDGLMPADEYFSLTLAEGAGLARLCVIWTRAEITITGFQSNPGVVVQGSTESGFDNSTGTLTIRQPWTAGNIVCYSFLNPEAASGRTLQILPLDSESAGPQLTIAEVRYTKPGEQGPIATPDRYLQHFPQLLEARWPNNRTVNVVVYGDSTALGYNSLSRPDFLHAYPHFLRGRLKERYPYAVINVMATGRYGLGPEEALNEFQTNVLDRQPDLVVLDFGREAAGSDLTATLDALSGMASAASNNAIRVLLATPPLSNDALPPESDVEAVEALAEGIRELATGLDVGLVDFHSVLNASDASAEDFFNAGVVTQEGHWRLAEEIMEWFPANPLSSIPSESVHTKCGSVGLDCAFQLEGLQGRTILLQRTGQLNRFWSTIDVITPSASALTEANVSENMFGLTKPDRARFYRVCFYN